MGAGLTRHKCTRLIPNNTRSLTARQREILQAYADDVEGHPSYFSTTPPPSASPINNDGANGTTYSSSSSHPRERPHEEPAATEHAGREEPPISQPVEEPSSPIEEAGETGSSGFLGGLFSGVKSALGIKNRR